ncbi:MAG: FAD-dependent oxidoreductase [Desulfobacteraceae bacterium]
MKRVVIIGAVALGPKVASRLRRLDPDAEITLVDKDSIISYGGCGIPYYVGGDIADIEGLFSTASHVKRDIEFFRSCKGIKVMSRVEATCIDRKKKRVHIKNLADGIEDTLDYDKLVISTGTSPLKPPVKGADLPDVQTVSNLHHAKALKDKIAGGRIEKAVVIGAGAIGIEMAEALCDLWGVETTLIEMADQVMPYAVGKNMARIAENHLKENGVNVLTGEKVSRINADGNNRVVSVDTENDTIECDVVVLSTGVKPNTELAADAGLAVGKSGGILVNRRMQTTDPDIYAGGDCVELLNLVSGEHMLMPLGSLANRQGRVIAANINGGASRFRGTVGTFCIKIFEMGFARSGLTVQQAKAAGFDPVHSIVTQHDRAHFYPEAKLMYITLISDRKSRRVLGIEAAGRQKDAVKARVDAVAPLLSDNTDVDEICCLETGYAPPCASAMDIINNAGNVLDNILNGNNRPVDGADFLKEFKTGKTRVLDVRENNESIPFSREYEGRRISIPQSELRQRYTELPDDEFLYILCGTGARSYEAQVFLDGKGIVNTLNIQGGYGTLMATDPDFVSNPDGGRV